MRKVLIVLLLVIVTMSILWIFAGRQISEFVDRFKTQTIDARPLNFIVYQGTGEGGVLRMENLNVNLAPLNPHVGSTKDDQFAIASAGKVFAFGPARSLTENRLETVVTELEQTFRIERSYLPWLTFEQSLAPSLNRHEYYEFVCARNRQRLRMMWSVDPRTDATSLIRVEISDASR